MSFTVAQAALVEPLQKTYGICLLQMSSARHRTTFNPHWAKGKMTDLIGNCVEKELLGGEYLVDGFTFRAVHLGFVSPELSFTSRRPSLHGPASI